MRHRNVPVSPRILLRIHQDNCCQIGHVLGQSGFVLAKRSSTILRSLVLSALYRKLSITYEHTTWLPNSNLSSLILYLLYGGDASYLRSREKRRPGRVEPELEALHPSSFGHGPRSAYDHPPSVREGFSADRRPFPPLPVPALPLRNVPLQLFHALPPLPVLLLSKRQQHLPFEFVIFVDHWPSSW